MAKQVLRDEQQAVDSKELNTSRLTITVKDNLTGEVLINEQVASVLLSGLQTEEEDGNTFTSSAVGEFSEASMIQSLESSIDVVVHKLKARYGLESYDLLELMGHLTNGAMERNYNKQEQLMAMIQGMAKMASKGE